MEEQQRSGWRIAGKVVLWISCIGVTLSLVISLYGGYRHGWQWTGLVKNADFPKRTLWDWLQLLIIPAVLAGGGLWFNRRQQAHTLETEKLRAQDEALHAYLERMSQLLVDPDHPLQTARPGGSLSTVARAQTLTVLPRLDGRRKRSVVQFLYEAGLINRPNPIVVLGGTTLTDPLLEKYGFR